MVMRGKEWMRKNTGTKKENIGKNKRKPETGVLVELDLSREDADNDNDLQPKRQNRGGAFSEQDHYPTI